VLKLGHFGKEMRNVWEVFECGAGEEWGSVGISWNVNTWWEQNNFTASEVCGNLKSPLPVQRARRLVAE
jgi:hypothetical protein